MLECCFQNTLPRYACPAEVTHGHLDHILGATELKDSALTTWLVHIRVDVFVVPIWRGFSICFDAALLPDFMLKLSIYTRKLRTSSGLLNASLNSRIVAGHPLCYRCSTLVSLSQPESPETDWRCDPHQPERSFLI